jgi:hypothetical protein
LILFLTSIDPIFQSFREQQQMPPASILTGLSRGARQAANLFDYAATPEVTGAKRPEDIATPLRALARQRRISTTEGLRPRNNAPKALTFFQPRRLCSAQAVAVGLADRIKQTQAQVAVLPTALAVEKMRRQRFPVSVAQAAVVVAPWQRNIEKTSL